MTGARAILAALWGVLALAVTGGALAQGGPRPAELTVLGDVVCSYPNFVDHQVSTDSYVLSLPDIDGPVAADGAYVNNGTGYTLAGVSKVAGDLRDDAELVLTSLQWNYQGEWMPSSAPFVPTTAQPVRVPLEPGGETVVVLAGVSVAEGTSCSGTITYRIAFERETQIWDVALAAEHRVSEHETYEQFDAATGVSTGSQPYEHGVTFNTTLGALVTLERRKGAWQFREATITRANLRYDYTQSPEIYSVTAVTCANCAQVSALVGQALGGSSDGNTLSLTWPGAIRPVVDVDTVFALACPPGANRQSCENRKRNGSRTSAEDGDTFQRAAGHVLKLAETTQPFEKSQSSPKRDFFMRHVYTLVRVK